MGAPTGEAQEGVFDQSIFQGVEGYGAESPRPPEHLRRIWYRVFKVQQFVVDRNPQRLERPCRGVETPGPRSPWDRAGDDVRQRCRRPDRSGPGDRARDPPPETPPPPPPDPITPPPLPPS